MNEERLVFDLVLLSEEGDDPAEPILFVRGEGHAVAQIKECARVNKNARARWRRRQRKLAATT